MKAIDALVLFALLGGGCALWLIVRFVRWSSWRIELWQWRRSMRRAITEAERLYCRRVEQLPRSMAEWAEAGAFKAWHYPRNNSTRLRSLEAHDAVYQRQDNIRQEFLPANRPW